MSYVVATLADSGWLRVGRGEESRVLKCRSMAKKICRFCCVCRQCVRIFEKPFRIKCVKNILNIIFPLTQVISRPWFLSKSCLRQHAYIYHLNKWLFKTCVSVFRYLMLHRIYLHPFGIIILNILRRQWKIKT